MNHEDHRQMEAPTQSAAAVEETEELQCLNGPEGCDGPVEYRFALSATGRSFPRCDRHWAKRLDEQDRINQRYPSLQPRDFDPDYAGERWEED